jgi:hypothetical protein
MSSKYSYSSWYSVQSSYSYTAWSLEPGALGLAKIADH